MKYNSITQLVKGAHNEPQHQNQAYQFMQIRKVLMISL